MTIYIFYQNSNKEIVFLFLDEDLSSSTQQNNQLINT